MRQKIDSDSRQPLKNQKALVTGASLGIGEACAIALAAAGASVVVNYLSRRTGTTLFVDGGMTLYPEFATDG